MQMNDPTTGAGASAGDCRVLVVDDNVDSAQSMSLLLGLEGYQVECAYDGEEALVRADAFRPHVVLLDLGLPRFSGYEVARRLRGAAQADGARIDEVLLVAVSGYGRERDRQAAREAGFDLHLTKPADPDEVLRVLADRAALRAAGRRASAEAGFTTTARPDPAAGGPQPSGPAPEPTRDGASAPAPSLVGGRDPQGAAHVAGAARNA
jgi:CheY-like chemotaxis protein